MKSLEFNLDSLVGMPALVDLGTTSAWVVRDEQGNVRDVIENKCAHMGSVLRCTNSGFQCDSHNWSYDKEGRNEVTNNPSLNTLEFVSDGKNLRIFVEEYEQLFAQPTKELDGTETLELVSHATFLLETSDLSVIFDPWIKGDAYWGAWTLFPNNPFDITRLKSVDCIVITHPHPDHFHPETLKLFSRDTKIIMPAFPSGIIPSVLKNLGFTNFQEVEWEVGIELSTKISLSFLRPNSFWEDSAVFVQVGEFTWLNQNDSGAPLKGNKIPKDLDLLTTSFDFGASGYPLTWDMSVERKKQIVENGKKQILETIKSRCVDLNAKNYAPFAGYWRHGLAEHANYAQALMHTTMDDLRAALSSTNTKLIATIPSSTLNLKSLEHKYDENVLSSLNSGFVASRIEKQLAGQVPKRDGIKSQLLTHLSQLRRMSLATNTEHVIFTVHVPKLKITVSETFGERCESEPISIEVSISPEIAELVTSDNPMATWHQIDIGYHGTWKRNPDIYPVNFMRLLQLGYVHRLASDVNSVSDDEILAQPIARVMEANPELARIVLNRAGLPCASCGLANMETIQEALTVHSVGKNQRKILLGEIKAILV
jgi:hypothetical protein